jgi:hypothetical protein
MESVRRVPEFAERGGLVEEHAACALQAIE